MQQHYKEPPRGAREAVEAAKAFGLDRIVFYLIGKPEERSAKWWRYDRRKLAVNVEAGTFSHFETGQGGGLIDLIIFRGLAKNVREAVDILYSAMGENLPPVPALVGTPRTVRAKKPCACGAEIQPRVTYLGRDAVGWYRLINVRKECTKCNFKKIQQLVNLTRKGGNPHFLPITDVKNKTLVEEIKRRRTIYGLFGAGPIPKRIAAAEGQKCTDYLWFGRKIFAVNFKDINKTTVRHLVEAGVEHVTIFPDLKGGGPKLAAKAKKILEGAGIAVSEDVSWATCADYDDIADALDASGRSIYWGRA